MITALLGLSLGITSSAFGRERRKSESTAGIAAVALWFGPAILDQVLQARFPAWPTLFSLAILSPSYLHAAAFAPGFGSQGGRFSAAVLSNLLVIGVLQSIATAKLKSSWQNEAFGGIQGWRDRWRERRQARHTGRGQSGARRRAGRLSVNAFYWLSTRERWPTIRLWALLVVSVAVSGLIAWLAHDEGNFGVLWLYITVPACSLLLRVLIVDEASRTFINQRSSGALEMLLATPLTVADVVNGQWLGLWRRFAKPALAFAVLCLCAWVATTWLPAATIFNLQSGELRSLLLAASLMFAADVAALGWTAMWLSLKCRRRADVAGSVLARILLLPDICWLFVLISFGDLVRGRGVFWGLGWWLFIGLAIDAFFIAWSRWRLMRSFRRLATLEYVNSGPSGEWGRWLGRRYARWVQRR